MHNLTTVRVVKSLCCAVKRNEDFDFSREEGFLCSRKILTNGFRHSCLAYKSYVKESCEILVVILFPPISSPTHLTFALINFPVVSMKGLFTNA